jgi:hypothetical protein
MSLKWLKLCTDDVGEIQGESSELSYEQMSPQLPVVLHTCLLKTVKTESSAIDQDGLSSRCEPQDQKEA